MSNKVYPGHPYPLGATWDGNGVNFALYADNATGVELCLYDPKDDKKETEKIKLIERTHQIWHVYLPNAKAGSAIWLPGSWALMNLQNGHRFNPNKLLIDPYAKAIAGTIEWHDSLFGYELGHPDEDLSFSKTDSAPYVPKSVVIDPNFDWEGDKPPKFLS